MNELTKSETSQTTNVSGDVYGNTKEGDIFQSFYSQTNFDEISFEDLKLQTKKLPEIQIDFLNSYKEQRILVFGGELGGINKKELILKLAYHVAKDYRLTFQNTDIYTKVWRPSSKQEKIDLEAELINTKEPTIFVFYDIEPQEIKGNLEVIRDNILSFKHYIFASTNRSYKIWHLSDNAIDFFPTDLKLEKIYGKSFLVEELQKKLSNLQEELQKELNQFQEEWKKDLEQVLEKLDKLKNEYEQLEVYSKKLGNLKGIQRFVKLLGQEFNNYIKTYKSEIQKKSSSEELEIPLRLKIDFDSLIVKSGNDETFIRSFFYNNLTAQQQLVALGISFLDGMFEDQLFTTLERVFKEAWKKKHPSIVDLDYSDLEELRYYYFDFQENNDIYEQAFHTFNVVKTKRYKTNIRLVKIVAKSCTLYRVAWESHRRQIINGLKILVNIVKESAITNNQDIPENWDLYGTFLRRRKLQKAVSNTLSDIIYTVGINDIGYLYNPLFELARDKEEEVRYVTTKILTNLYKDNKKEEMFRIFQFLYDYPRGKELEKENKNSNNKFQRNETQKKEDQNLVNKAILEIKDKVDKFQNLFITKEVKNEPQKQKRYYINKKLDWRDFIGMTVASSLGEIIYESYNDEKLSRDFYDWLRELSKSRLYYVHRCFGNITLYEATPLYLKQIRDFLKEIVEDNRKWLYEDEDHRKWLYQAVAKSLQNAYNNYPKNREEVKNILENWYEEVSKENKYNQKEAFLITIVLTYGGINYDSNEHDKFPISLQNACSYLGQILINDKYSLIRKYIINSVLSLTFKYLEEIEEWLANLISILREKEKKHLINTFTKIYIEQKIEKNSTAINIENIMNKWAIQNNVPTQQIAIKTLVSFAKIGQNDESKT